MPEITDYLMKELHDQLDKGGHLETEIENILTKAYNVGYNDGVRQMRKAYQQAAEQVTLEIDE